MKGLENFKVLDFSTVTMKAAVRWSMSGVHPESQPCAPDRIKPKGKALIYLFLKFLGEMIY